MEYKTTEGTRCNCLECGSGIYGRTDKKFCSSVCKNSYYNRQYRDIKRLKRRIVETLHSNYSILDSILKLGTTTIGLEDLHLMGFDSSCMSGHAKGRNGHEEYFCFDISYFMSATKIFNIHRMENPLRRGAPGDQ